LREAVKAERLIELIEGKSELMKAVKSDIGS